VFFVGTQCDELNVAQMQFRDRVASMRGCFALLTPNQRITTLQEDQGTLYRRNFIRFASAGVVASAAHVGLAQTKPAAPAPRKAAPTPVTIHSSKLQVTLDSATALALSYRFEKSGIASQGEPRPMTLQARICRIEPRDYTGVEVKVLQHVGSADSQQFHCTAAYTSVAASVDFTLFDVLEGTTVFIKLGTVLERPGFELISISMPSLVSVPVNSTNGWGAHGDSGGDFVMLAEAKSGHLAANSFLG
jgi:hypothetical protein